VRLTLKILLVSIILYFRIDSVQAQNKYSIPFQDGESVQYKVYYNLAFIWVDAASVKFSVRDTIQQGQKLIQYLSSGSSYPSYDWIFKVRDNFHSWVDPSNFTPTKFLRNTSEGSHRAYNWCYFYPSSGQIRYNIDDNTIGKKTSVVAYKAPAFDVLSAVYYLRTIDVSLLKKGALIPIKVFMDDKLITINIYYDGDEIVEHKNGKKYPSHKFRTKGVPGTIFDEDSDILVWVSKDANKIPIKVEAEIIIGTVIAFVESVRKPKVKDAILAKDFLK